MSRNRSESFSLNFSLLDYPFLSSNRGGWWVLYVVVAVEDYARRPVKGKLSGNLDDRGSLVVFPKSPFLFLVS